MKKLALVVVLLAVPAIAFAAVPSATMSLKKSDGTTSQIIDVGSPIGTWSGTIAVAIYLDTYANAPEGVANFGGVLTSASSVFKVATGNMRNFTGCAPFQAGDQLGATPLSSGLAGAIPSTKDFGIASTQGLGTGPGGNYMAPDDAPLPWKMEVITITVTNAPVGTHVLNIGSGYVGTTSVVDEFNTDTVAMDYTYGGGFSLIITPEPATMLLLAAALPFLRRRSA